MKTFRLSFTMLFLLVFYVVRAQDNDTVTDTTLNLVDPIKAEKAKALVLNYVRIISKGGKPDSLVKICGIPFSWDKKRIIDNWADFKAAQQEIISKMGKNRQFEIDTIFVKAARSEILDEVIPLNVYYLIAKIKATRDNYEKTAEVLFAVQITDNPKIIGFSD